MSRSINAFDLAILLAKVSRKPEELASNVDLNKLVKSLNHFFSSDWETGGLGANTNS